MRYTCIWNTFQIYVQAFLGRTILSDSKRNRTNSIPPKTAEELENLVNSYNNNTYCTIVLRILWLVDLYIS